MEFTLDAYESGFETVLTYATVAIKHFQNESNRDRAEMLLQKCEQYKIQMVHTGELQIKDFEDEDIVLLLADNAEEYIEEQFLKILSIDVMDNVKDTKQLRKAHTAISLFKDCIKEKSAVSINQYYIDNGIDDDILIEKIIDAIGSPSNAESNALINNELKVELRTLALSFVREKLGIKQLSSQKENG